MAPPGPFGTTGWYGNTRFKLRVVLQSEAALGMDVPVTRRSWPTGTRWPSLGDVIVTASLGNVAVGGGCCGGVDEFGNWAYEILSRKTLVVGASVITNKEKDIINITDIFFGVNLWTIIKIKSSIFKIMDYNWS